MTQQLIDIGILPNDQNGDPLRIAFDKINQNFTEIFTGQVSISVNATGGGGASLPIGAVQYRGVNTLRSIAINGNRAVASSNPGELRYTDTPEIPGSWEKISLSTTASITSIVSSSSTSWAAVGTNGTILISTDGISWTVPTTVPTITATLNSISAYVGTGTVAAYVTVGDNGEIYSSATGSTWIQRLSPVATSLYGVCSTSSSETIKYVAVGANGTILTSVDGVNWVFRASGITTTLRAIAWNQTQKFVAVGDGGVCVQSNDGITWNTVSTGVTANLVSISSGLTVTTDAMIAVGNNGTAILTRSASASSWQTTITGLTNPLYSVSHTSGDWIIVGENGVVLLSTPLGTGNITWSNKILPGEFAGSNDMIFDPATGTLTLKNLVVTNLANIAMLKLPGGLPGQILATDGNGCVYWVNPNGTGGTGTGTAGTAAGGNMQVQYNNLGSFAASNTFYFNSTTGVLTAPIFSGSGAMLTDIQANQICGNFPYTEQSNLANVANLANYAVTVIGAAQPNITSLGNLTSLNVNGISNVGSISNLKILGGNAGQVLQTDGAGGLAWVDQLTVPGMGSAAGTNTQVQFNLNGALSGDSNLTYDSTTGTLTSAYFSGNGAGLTGISATSITGVVPSALTATTASQAIVANIANTALSVDGANVNGAVLQSQFAAIATSANTALSVSGANVVGTVSLATTATTALSVNGGNIIGNVGNANLATYVMHVIHPTQSNITQLGTLVDLSVQGTANLGDVSNLRLGGGFTGQVLTSLGNDLAFWKTPPAITGQDITQALIDHTITITSSRSLITADAGKKIIIDGAASITVPVDTASNFELNTDVMLVNKSAAPVTIVEFPGVNLYWSDNALTGSRTLGAKGVATLMKIDPNKWIIYGHGIS